MQSSFDFLILIVLFVRKFTDHVVISVHDAEGCFTVSKIQTSRCLRYDLLSNINL